MQKHEESCYLRAQLQQCSDSTHLNVIIDSIARYTKWLGNEKFICLPVHCDESRSSIVGTVTIEDDIGLTELKNGFSGDVIALFSEESECQTAADFVVIICPMLYEKSNEDSSVTVSCNRVKLQSPGATTFNIFDS